MRFLSWFLFGLVFFKRVCTLWKAKAKKKKKKKKKNNTNRSNEHIIVSRFFKIITWKSRKVYVLSKNLHCTKRIVLSLYIDEECTEIKFEAEIKFKMAAIVDVAGWRHKSRDSTPCDWNTWRYRLFCCYFRHCRRINRTCQITECLLFFRISTEPAKRLLDQYIFGHTHHWSHS